MKYGVQIVSSSGIYHETNSLTVARATAMSMANWNVECQVILLETGDVLTHFPPYDDTHTTIAK